MQRLVHRVFVHPKRLRNFGNGFFADPPPIENVPIPRSELVQRSASCASGPSSGSPNGPVPSSPPPGRPETTTRRAHGVLRSSSDRRQIRSEVPLAVPHPEPPEVSVPELLDHDLRNVVDERRPCPRETPGDGDDEPEETLDEERRRLGVAGDDGGDQLAIGDCGVHDPGPYRGPTRNEGSANLKRLYSGAP